MPKLIDQYILLYHLQAHERLILGGLSEKREDEFIDLFDDLWQRMDEEQQRSTEEYLASCTKENNAMITRIVDPSVCPSHILMAEHYNDDGTCKCLKEAIAEAAAAPLAVGESDGEKMALMRRIFHLAYDHGETFEEDNLGSALAYLMGAILNDTKIQIIGGEKDPHSGELFKALSTAYGKDDPIWKYITLDDDSEEEA